MMHVHIFTCLFCVWISQIKVCLKGDQWSINNLITYPSSLFRESLYFWYFHQKVLWALQTNPTNSLIIIHTLQALRGEFLKIPPLFSVFHTYTVFTYAFYPTHTHTHTLISCPLLLSLLLFSSISLQHTALQWEDKVSPSSSSSSSSESLPPAHQLSFFGVQTREG